MKTGITTFLAALLLLPAVSFAHDSRGRDSYRYSRRDRVEDAFERQHPRWPRFYCHRHAIPLNADDTREHCHNWNRDSRYRYGDNYRYNDRYRYGNRSRSNDRSVFWPWNRFWH